MIISFTLLFILFSLLEKGNSGLCGPENPTSFEDCFEYSTEESTCCYSSISLLNVQNKTSCLMIPNTRVNITPFITSLDVGLAQGNGLINIFIDCNVTEVNETGIPNTRCGVDNPINKEECFESSLNNVSCCFLQNPNGDNVCLWNKDRDSFEEEYFGVKIYCDDFYLNSYFKLKNIFLFLLIFLCLYNIL